MKEYGGILKEARKGERKTLREVAQAVGLSVGYISDIERGRRTPPNLEVVSKMQSFLRVMDNRLVVAAQEESDIPSDLKSIFMERLSLNTTLLRASADCDENELNKIIEQIKNKAKNGGK